MLNKIMLKPAEFDAEVTLSPEYWLSHARAKRVSRGIPLSELVEISKAGLMKIPANSWVLDTGNADRGLLAMKIENASPVKDRISHKKVVPEGSVLISRLRPYLRQVAFLPRGICERLGVSHIMCSTEFYVLTPKTKESIAFLVPWLLTTAVQAVFGQATTGGHHPRFDESLLLSLAVSPEICASRDKSSREVENAVLSHVDAQLTIARLIENTAGA